MTNNYRIGVELVADAKQATAAIQNVGQKVEELNKKARSGVSISSDGGGVSSFSAELSEGKASLEAFLGPVGMAAAAVTAVGTAAYSAGTFLFNLAKNASDVGSVIKDFQDKTGLSAETIGTLKFNLEQSGLELNNFAKPLNSVTELLYKSSNGNKEATETLAKFGVTAKDTADTALSKILEKIYNTENETQKMGLAMEVAGAKGAGSIRALSENVQGDLNGAIKKSREMGLVLSQDAVDAADAFGDSLGKLSHIATMTSSKFALKFAPEITSAMDWISDEFVANQSKVEAWGDTLADIMRGVSVTAKEEGKKTADDWISSFGRAMENGIVDAGNWINRNLNPVYNYAVSIREKGKADREREKAQWNNVPIYDGGDAVSIKARPKKTEIDPKEKERILKETQQAQLQLNKASQEGNKQFYGEALDSLKNYYKDFQLETSVFRSNYIQAEQQFFAAQKALLGKEFDQRAAAETNKAAREAIQAEYANAINALEADSRKRKDEVDNLIAEVEKGKIEKQKKAADDEVNLRERTVQRIVGFNQIELANYTAKLSEQTEFARRNYLDRQLSAEDTERSIFLAREDYYEKSLVLLQQNKAAYAKYGFDVKEIDIQITELKAKQLAEQNDAREKASQKEKDRLDAEIAKNKELIRLRYAAGTRPRVVPGAEVNNATPRTAMAEFKDGLFSAAGIQKAQSSADILKNVYTDLGSTVIDIFGQMAGAAEQTLASYILTGEGGGAAFKQLTAQIIAGLAVQAGIKAIFEVAEGFAAQATTWGVPNPSSIAHFTAAKIYGAVAVGAAVTGVAIGASGGLDGKGSKSQSDSPDYQTTNPNYLNTNSNQSNRKMVNSPDTQFSQLSQSVNNLNTTVDALHSKISSMKASDVVTKGFEQKPGLASQAVTKDLRRNGTQKTEMGKALGLK